MKLLQETPEALKGNVWSFLKEIDPYFISLGSALVTLFFLIALCSESVDIKEELRFDNLLRMFLRISLAEWMVVNHLELAKIFFQIASSLIQAMGIRADMRLKLGKEMEEAIGNFGVGESIVFFLIAILLAMIILCCSLVLLYTVYFRFLKLYLAMPFGALAFSTITGNHAMANTALHYGKYLATVALEAVTMALAIFVAVKFIDGGLPSMITGQLEPWTKCLVQLLEMTFTVVFTTASVKGAEQLTQKVIGG